MAGESKIVTAILFDFDGTICNSFTDEMINVFYNTLSPELKRKIPIEIVKMHRDFTIEEIIKKLSLSKLEMLLTAFKFRRLFSSKIKDFTTIKGMGTLVKSLHVHGVQLFIVTSNRKKNVQKFLEANGLELFDHILSEYSLGKKARKIKHIIDKYKLDPATTFYVGDEARDVKAAHEAGIKAISVTWGMNSRTLLQKYDPEFIVEVPEDILQVLNLK